MVEQTNTPAAEPEQPDPAPHATLKELVAEPERVAGQAATHPVHIDGPDGAALVLLNAETFERLQRHAPKALYASEMTEAEIEEMLAQPIPAESVALDDLVLEGWLDAQR